MRKLIMWNLVTLDGYFEGPASWELGWHEYAWGGELEQFSIKQLRSADMLLFGRVTYEGMAAYWPSADGEVADLMNSISKFVFSSTLREAGWRNTRVVRRAAHEEVAELKAEQGNAMYVLGSGLLCSALIQHHLIDEYRLCVAPVVLGGGNHLFKPGLDMIKMRLLEAQPLKTGGVILRYQPA